jgi:hypothetical protein
MPRRDFLRVKTSLLERETRRENWPKKCFGQKNFTRRAEPFPLIGKSRRKNNLRIGGIRRESGAGF